MFDSCYSRQREILKGINVKIIERLNTENPKEFWDAIHKLGPQKANLILVEIYDNSGEINTDTNFVLNEWSNQFNSLLQGYNRNDFDKLFYDFAMGEKERMENGDFGDDQAWCNTDITETEVKFVLNKARLRKAIGIDNISYEVLKNSISIPLLRCLFSKMF